MSQPTRKDTAEDVYHGVRVADPYRWLEDDRAPEVEKWVADQAEITDRYLKDIPYRDAVLKRVQQLYDYEKLSAPEQVQNALFYFRQAGTQNHSVLMKMTGNGTPQVILDPNTWSSDGTVALADHAVSEDGHWLAFAKSKAGSDWREIYVMDLQTMKVLPDVLEWVKVSNISFHKDGFFYSRYPAPTEGKSELSSANVGHIACYHKVGTPQREDVVLYSDASAPDQFNFCYVPDNASFIIRSARRGAQRGARLWIREFDKPNDPWHPIWTSTETDLNILGVSGKLILAHTDSSAPNGRVVRVDDLWGKPKLVDVIPEGTANLAGVSMAGGKLFITRMVDVKHTVDIYDYTGKHLGVVTLPGPGTVGGFNGRVTDEKLFYTFSSFTQPNTIFEYDVATARSKVWKSSDAQFDPSLYEARQVFVVSKDGAKVPMYIVHKKGLQYNGEAPTMLYGYGGFNISQNAQFSATLVAWLEQGGVYAQANLRGGSEYGETWHDAGTKLRKQNVFDDAIACAEWLIANKVTSKSRLAVHGRSNGGLLVGALMTQRPDLFRVALPEVGVMDMLRYHLFTIGWNWASDYGTVDDAKEFEALYKYSPYHNLKTGVDYPATMVMTADHDDRVVPAHSFKFFARLKELYKGNKAMLLRVETNSGHGASNTTKKLEGIVDRYIFMWHEMGVTPKYDSSVPGSH